MRRIHSKLLVSFIVAVVAIAGCASSSVIDSETTSTGGIIDAPDTDEPDSTNEEANVGTQPATTLPETASSVADVMLNTTTAQALSRVDLVGLDSGFDGADATAVTTVDGQDLEFPVLVDDEGAYLIAPLVVDLPEEVRTVELRLRAGDEVGPPLVLTIEGLPEAAGAAAAYLEAMRDSVDRAAAALGSSYDELATVSLDDVPDALFTLKAQQLIIDDGTDNDVTSWLLGDGERSAEEQALVDAIFGHVAAEQTTLVAVDETSQLDAGERAKPTPEPTPSRNVTGGKGKAVPTSYAVNATAKMAIAQGSNCSSSRVQVNTPEQLEHALGVGLVAKKATSGAAGKVQSDIANTLGVASAAPGAWGVAAGIGSAVISADLMSDLADVATYPSSLGEMSVEVNTTEFNADFTEPGTLTAVNVVAMSQGGGFGSNVVGLATGLGTLGASWQVSLGGTVLSNLGADALNEATAWCPTEWTVDIVDSDLYELKRISGEIDFDLQAKTFSPTELGRAAMRVEAKIAGLNVAQAVEITTNELQITLSPGRVEVQEPGDLVDLRVSFINSDTELAEWETEAGSLVNVGGTTEGEFVGTLATPDDPGAYPFLVTAESAATTGLYALESKPAQAIAVASISLADLIIEPAGAIVGVEQSVQYTARNRQGDPVEVRWETTGGSISSDGLFTAGQEPGSFSVSASLVNNPGVAASVTVTVVDGGCATGRWSLRVGPWMDQITDAFSELSGGAGAMQYVSGDYLLAIDDAGNFEAQRVGLTFNVVAPQGSLTMGIDSVETGTVVFEPDEDRSDPPNRLVGMATVTEVSSAATVRIAGFEREVSSPSGFAGVVEFECGDGVFVATSDGVTAIWDYLGPVE